MFECVALVLYGEERELEELAVEPQQQAGREAVQTMESVGHSREKTVDIH